MARYNTTITKKDGSKASGYIEDGKSYYDNGTSISAGDSVVDSTGKTWTKGGDTSSNASSEVAMINNAIRANNAGIKKAINTEKARRQNTYTPGDSLDSYSALANYQKQLKQQELAKARANALSSLNAEENATNQAYANQIKQTATNADIALKNYFENVANRGQTYSGSTAQGEIAHNIARQNNISALQQAQASALADIARRRQLAEQGYIDDLQSASNAIDLKVLENRISNEQNAGAEALKKAQLMAELGDYSGLQALGYNTSVIEEQNKAKASANEAEQVLNQAKLMAQVGDFSGLKALGYDTTALEKQWNADINNTYSLINQRSNETKKVTEDNSKNYNEMLEYIREITPSMGNSYDENMKASRELLHSELSNTDMINIMKRTNVRPEAFVKLLVDEGYPREQIEAFVESYTNKQGYRDSLIKYAYQ
jgi:hypothetical protein